MDLRTLQQFVPPLKEGEKVQLFSPRRPNKPILTISREPNGALYAIGEDFYQRVERSVSPYYKRVASLDKPLEDYL